MISVCVGNRNAGEGTQTGVIMGRGMEFGSHGNGNGFLLWMRTTKWYRERLRLVYACDASDFPNALNHIYVNITLRKICLCHSWRGITSLGILSWLDLSLGFPATESHSSRLSISCEQGLRRLKSLSSVPFALIPFS